jgi:16S rRNA (cytidine1402-2'-O)-methyltransferase
VVVCRELTKLHEEFVRGTLGQVRDHFQEHPAKGEITLVLEGAPEIRAGGEADEVAARALAAALLEEGITPSRAARDLARRLNLPRNLAYRVVQEVSSGRSAEGADGATPDRPVEDSSAGPPGDP